MNKLLGKGVEADWDINDLENPGSTADEGKTKSVDLKPAPLKQAKLVKRGTGSKEPPSMPDVVKRIMLLERIIHKVDEEKLSHTTSPKMYESSDIPGNPQMKSPMNKFKSIEQEYIESKMHEYLKKYESSSENGGSVGPDHTLSRGSISSSPQHMPVTEVFSRYKSTPQGRLVSPGSSSWLSDMASEKPTSEYNEVV